MKRIFLPHRFSIDVFISALASDSDSNVPHQYEMRKKVIEDLLIQHDFDIARSLGPVVLNTCVQRAEYLYQQFIKSDLVTTQESDVAEHTAERNSHFINFTRKSVVKSFVDFLDILEHQRLKLYSNEKMRSCVVKRRSAQQSCHNFCVVRPCGNISMVADVPFLDSPPNAHAMNMVHSEKQHYNLSLDSVFREMKSQAFSSTSFTGIDGLLMKTISHQSTLSIHDLGTYQLFHDSLIFFHNK